MQKYAGQRYAGQKFSVYLSESVYGIRRFLRIHISRIRICRNTAIVGLNLASTVFGTYVVLDTP